jgi:hypothetical protein
MKFKILALLLVSFSSFGSNWTVSQTTLHHVQIGSANLMYISFDKHANVSQITCGGLPVKNWAALPLDLTGPKVQALISLALSAQAQSIKVDLGGPGTCQKGAYPTLDYIRVGQYTGPVK